MAPGLDSNQDNQLQSLLLSCGYTTKTKPISFLSPNEVVSF